MTWTLIEVAYNGEEGETTDLYGPFQLEGKAQWDAQYLQEKINELPRDQNHWVTVSARPITALRGGSAFQAVIEEARKFLEPDDEPVGDHFRGMYSIDHAD